jgi:Ni,Fe-hydrogenase maturation factor
VPQTLEIGRKLQLKVPSGVKVVAVEAKNMYNLGEGLTEEMKKAVPAIAKKIKNILARIKS